MLASGCKEATASSFVAVDQDAKLVFEWLGRMLGCVGRLLDCLYVL